MSRVVRTLTTAIVALGFALLLPLGTVAAADCSLTVAPRTGVPGTEFVFKGKGFTPTTLSVTRGAQAPQMVDVSGPDSTFTFSLIASDPDVGKWRAVADGCAVVASVRVTLPPTATGMADSAPAQDEQAQLAGLVLVGVLFLGATASLLPRLTRAARAR